MQSPPLDDLNLPILQSPKGGLSLETEPTSIMSVYSPTEFLYPKDGVWKEENTVVSKPLSLVDDDAWMTVKQGYNNKKDGILSAIVLGGNPSGFFLCYSHLNKEVRIKQDSRDIWVLKPITGSRDTFTIELSVKEIREPQDSEGDKGEEPMLLTYGGDNQQVYMATPVTDVRMKERQYWKIVQ